MIDGPPADLAPIPKEPNGAQTPRLPSDPAPARITRTGAVMAAIRRRVATRTLAAGEKLPSIRALARQMQVSPSTVVEAYDRLAAEGLVRARPGSGFYVAGRVPAALRVEPAPPRDRAIDPLWVSRQSLDAPPGTIRPGCGWLPPEWMPAPVIRRALRTLARAEAGVLTDYGAPQGPPALRGLIARRGAADGIEAGTDQVLLTSSGTQAVDLICRLLLAPGDTVLVDDPCYFNFLATLRTHRVKLVSVPYTPTGPDLAAFAETLIRERPRLYLTNAAIHNPTGASLSPAVAHRLLTLAAAHELTIVEDEIFADFEHDPAPRLAALDGLAGVIRVGSFSKTLSASIRCGYVVARPDLIEGLIDLQVATRFGGPSPMAAEIVTTVLADGSYRRHLAELRTRLARQRQEIAGRLAVLGIEPWTVPRGGFYLWCRLPGGRDAADVARAALREGVVLAPGNVFSLAQSAPDLMRFNVAQMTDEAFRVLRNALAG